MSTLVWVHEDCLSPLNPALVAHPEAPAVFVWDDALVDAEGYSLKRIVFLYECLLELPVEIYRGPSVETLLTLADRAGAVRFAMAGTVNPRLLEVATGLQRRLEVIVHETEEFVPRNLDADLRRFARFWRRAESHAFRRTTR